MSLCHFNPTASRWGLFLTVATLAGCGQNKTEVYQVAKEAPSTPGAAQSQPAGMPPGHPNISSVVPRLEWKLPAGWETAAPGEMRVASFKVADKNGKQADISVVPLPGVVGHDLENVNRWRGTVGLPAVTDEGLGKLAQSVDIGGQPSQLYEQAGENPGSGDKLRILAAVSRRDGIAWYFKMSGDDELVAVQKPAFLEFLKSLTFPAATAQTELPPSHPPIDGSSGMMPPPGMVPPGMAQPASSQAKPAWKVPSGWAEAPAGQFLVAKYVISGADNTQAAVNVSQSAGTGGGLLMNVNRWRGQIGLSPLSDADLPSQFSSFDTPVGKATLVDMTGTDARTSQNARVVGAIVPQGDVTWFYKLMGNPDIVEKQKDSFVQFVQSAK